MTETLKLRALLERASVRPGKPDEMHLLVDIAAVGAPVDAVRPALSVVFVLDASGSMSGQPLEQVIASVGMLVDLLGPEDKVGVVSFSDEAAEVCPLQLLTDDAKRTIKRRVQAIRPLNSTNIEAGLSRARSMLGKRTPHERQTILLLSDGAPNVGASSIDDLAQIVEPMRADASVSTLGYGAGHNSDVLHAIATAGAGQYWFVPDPGEASLEFARAVGAAGDIVADGVELVLSPAELWEVREVLGQRVRFSREGPVVPLPDMREKQSRLVIAKVSVKAPVEAGRIDAVDVKVRFRAAGQQDEQSVSARVSIDIADREPVVVAEVYQAAMMARAEQVRVEARQAADRGNFDQAAAMLRRTISELERVPGYRPADGTPLSECVEQLVDEATEYEQRPSRDRYNSYRAMQLGVEVSQGAKHAAAWANQSSKSAAIMAGATGPPIAGVVIVKDGAGQVMQRLPILPEMTIGRSPANEICVASSQLSRRHTKLVCRNGRVVVIDLMSTNGTFLNGKPVKVPSSVMPGDRLTIGDMSFEIIVDDADLLDDGDAKATKKL